MTQPCTVQGPSVPATDVGAPLAAAQLSHELPSFHDWAMSPPHSSPHSSAKHPLSPPPSVTNSAKSTARSRTSVIMDQDAAASRTEPGSSPAGIATQGVVMSGSAPKLTPLSASDVPAGATPAAVAAIRPKKVSSVSEALGESKVGTEAEPASVRLRASSTDVASSKTSRAQHQAGQLGEEEAQAMPDRSTGAVQAVALGGQHQPGVLDNAKPGREPHGKRHDTGKDKQSDAQQIPFSIPFSGLTAALGSGTEVTVASLQVTVLYGVSCDTQIVLCRALQLNMLPPTACASQRCPIAT